MKSPRLLAALLLMMTAGGSILPTSSVQDQVLEYKARVSLVHRLLRKECVNFTDFTNVKREQLSSNQAVSASLELEIEKSLYSALLNQLIKCRKVNGKDQKPTEVATTRKPTPTTTPTANITQPTPTNTTTTTTTMPLAPECLTATDYNESWRMNHIGSAIKPGGPNSDSGYACDLHKNDTQWFRFSGAAGNRMLDTCPRWLSCGTGGPMWTDEDMPGDVGVRTKVNVYEVYRTNCRDVTHSVEVMRCSWNTKHDLIYKQLSNLDGACLQAFCGMM